MSLGIDHEVEIFADNSVAVLRVFDRELENENKTREYITTIHELSVKEHKFLVVNKFNEEDLEKSESIDYFDDYDTIDEVIEDMIEANRDSLIDFRNEKLAY